MRPGELNCRLRESVVCPADDRVCGGLGHWFRLRPSEAVGNGCDARHIDLPCPIRNIPSVWRVDFLFVVILRTSSSDPARADQAALFPGTRMSWLNACAGLSRSTSVTAESEQQWIQIA